MQGIHYWTGCSKRTINDTKKWWRTGKFQKPRQVSYLRTEKKQTAEAYTGQSNFNPTKKTQTICKYLKDSKIISSRRPTLAKIKTYQANLMFFNIYSYSFPSWIMEKANISTTSLPCWKCHSIGNSLIKWQGRQGRGSACKSLENHILKDKQITVNKFKPHME